MKKVCVVTGTRAEYGLLYWVMKGIQSSSKLNLEVIVTGMHLSPEFGLTYQEVEADGFSIDKKVESLLSSDSPVGVTKSVGVGIIGFSEAFADLKPDLVVVLGDRYETFAATIAAMIASIPIAHLHGGELTEGSFDDAIRHSITKMSYFHFVATEEYRQRVIQLGESPDRVYTVGGLGIDNVYRLNLLDRISLQNEIGLNFGDRNLLITFHPTTLEHGAATQQMNELLSALDSLDDVYLIFTMPNADPEGRLLIKMIDRFVEKRINAKAYRSLGQLRYLSLVAQVDAVVGNSSSGLTEVPSLGKATVNIGDRQSGRLKAASVIDCEPEKQSIVDAINEIYSVGFQSILENVINPYGEGGASDKVVQILESNEDGYAIKKKFYDLPTENDKE